MLQKICATGLFMLIGFTSFSQQATAVSNSPAASETTQQEKEEPKPVLTVSGSADLYYKYDFNKQVSNNRTSFTNSQNAFSLGMASVKLEHVGKKVSMVADLGFGTRAAEFAYTDAGTMAAIKQLYISYIPVEGLKLTAGSWATHVGYELVDPQLNRNYSMSYMFTNGPFTHTGLKAEYSKGKSSFMLGVSNPTDFRVVPGGFMNKKFAIAQYSYAASDAVKLYFNYVGGKGLDTSITNQFDFVGTATISSKFSVGLNATLNRTQAWDGAKNISGQSWWGTAAYLNLDPTSTFGLTLRSEYFNDDKGVKGINASLFANTLSANFKVGSFVFIPELRFESSSKPIYTDANSNGVKSATSLILAAVYKF